MSFFIQNAFADIATPSAQQPSGIPFFVILGVMILFMYLIVWRPQSKRMREQRNLLNSLAKGDEVITAGGLLGTINQVADTTLTLTIAQGIDITIQKSAVTGLLPKGTLKSV